MSFKMLQEGIEKKHISGENKLGIRKCYQIIKTYKRTDGDRHRQDKTKQENASYDMSFFQNRKAKRFFVIKRFNSYNRPIE